MNIRKAQLANLEQLLPLFNAYRSFYKREEASEKACAFLVENLKTERSVIFIAYNEIEQPIGFIQLYPRVSSLSMALYLYVSDLFVDSEHRRHGIAKKLMLHAHAYGVAVGAQSMQLLTGHDNAPAQKLYESLGYQHEQIYRTYRLNLL